MNQVAAAPRLITLKEFFTSAGIPRVGQYWEGQGGINAGPVFDDEGDFSHFLISGTEDGKDLAWGPYGKKIVGADSRNDGQSNTVALLGSGYECPAAEFCVAYKADGHSDFYMPAQREGNQCYITIPSHFNLKWYWFSTQSSADIAWGQNFVVGNQLASLKGIKGLVRAVRRFNPFVI